VPGNERTEHQDRGSHGLYQLVRGLTATNVRGIEVEFGAVAANNPHVCQQHLHGADVLEPGNIGQGMPAAGQQG